ncbi:MAG: hypothetical protein ACPG1C_08630 [Alphaproteobacteria bacterium]
MAQKVNENLLQHVAGQYAIEIGDIFQADHIVEFYNATSARQHLWYFWLEHHYVPTADPEAVRNKLVYAKAKDILSEAMGGHAIGLLRVFGKLPTAAMRKPAYSLLPEIILNKKNAAKLACHRSSLSERDIAILAVLPDQLCTCQIFGLIDNEVNAAAIAEISKLAMQANPTISWGKIRQALGKCDDIKSVFDVIEELAVRGLRFPAPPFTGISQAVPLDDPRKLMNAGLTYRNCLRGATALLIEVCMGETYFYEWHGEEQAILQLGYHPVWGWQISEVKKSGNESVSRCTLREIAEEFGISPLQTGYIWTRLEALTTLKSGADLDTEDWNSVQEFLRYSGVPMLTEEFHPSQTDTDLILAA